jgi:cobalt-precorrin-5B (C1)-methyltransferase
MPDLPDDRPLRTGFTTGACAMAAAKGAFVALIERRAVERVAIRLPRGETVEFVAGVVGVCLASSGIA